jgi:N-acetylglucosaminyldiphosphoundecaprenol N-acetyl-beta-D-mannosaminyltransferase
MSTPLQTRQPPDHQCFKVLGVRVDAVQIPGVVEQLENWIDRRERCHYVAVTGMHGVMEALHNPSFRIILNSADLVVPDGMPLVWLGRLNGHTLPRRVYGPEFMVAFCETTESRGYRHFFYGGKPGVAEKLASKLTTRFSRLRVAGIYVPPFRPLGPEEDEAVVRQIEQAAPDVLWVGLSTPKQECWMNAHRDLLSVPVLVGVGAAFDIHTGELRQAPRWMREHGLEWLFRMCMEPRRLWRRYIVYGSQFLFWVTLERLGLRKFE